MYDAVYLYALALNETVASGGSKRNGLSVAKKMHGKVFEGLLQCMENQYLIFFVLTQNKWIDGQWR